MVGKQTHPNSSYSHRQSVGAAAVASSSSSSPPWREKSTCSSKVIEFACSACVLCVCCPTSIVWCCVKIPCKICWRLAKKAKFGGVSCCDSRRVSSSAAYSSFSDMDYEYDDSICKSADSSKKRIS